MHQSIESSASRPSKIFHDWITLMFRPLSLKVQNKYFLGETMKSNVEQVLCQVVSLRVDERSHDDFVSFFFRKSQ